MCLQNNEMDIILLKPEDIRLELDEEQELTLKNLKKDKEYKGVEVNPAFPLSQMGRYVSFKAGNKAGEEPEEEIGMVKDIKKLDHSSREALRIVLEKMYFMPRITKIYDVEEEFGVTRWEVETKKGRCSFDIKSRRSDIRPYDNGRIIFHDVDGNRYEITDYRQLDKKSQKLLSSEI